MSRIEVGSGAGGGAGEFGVSVMLFPSVVPKDRNALLIVLDAVTPATVRLNVAVSKLKGLCGPLPVMLLFALLYVLPGPGPPIIKWAGPAAPPHRSHSRSPPPELFSNAQPVEAVAPPFSRLILPLLAMSTSWVALDAKVPVIWPVDSTKPTSEIPWSTSIGLFSRFVNVTVTVFVPVVKVAVAFSGRDCGPSVEPAGVEKVMVVALAKLQTTQKISSS